MRSIFIRLLSGYLHEHLREPCAAQVMGSIYLLFLWFQLVTHAELFAGDEGDEEEAEEAARLSSFKLRLGQLTSGL